MVHCYLKSLFLFQIIFIIVIHAIVLKTFKLIFIYEKIKLFAFNVVVIERILNLKNKFAAL